MCLYLNNNRSDFVTMANLKTDLDQYLLKNETRRSYNFSLPSFSTPSFMSRSNDETPSTTSTTASWFENVQKEYCTLVSVETAF